MLLVNNNQNTNKRNRKAAHKQHKHDVAQPKTQYTVNQIHPHPPKKDSKLKTENDSNNSRKDNLCSQAKTTNKHNKNNKHDNTNKQRKNKNKEREGLGPFGPPKLKLPKPRQN